MSPRGKPFNNPFTHLKLEPKKKPSPPDPTTPAKLAPAELDESELFLRSVGEVTPVRSGKSLAPPREPPTAASLHIADEETEALTRLSELVAGEGPFDLSDTDEFIEGSVQGLDERVRLKLRRGEFAVQAHLDLHGMTKAEAKEALERFIHQARLKGHRCVLVVHGRGLHSKDQLPVLKENLQSWLSRGRVGRSVLAFTSARPKDGGAGAVYVLLRR